MSTENGRFSFRIGKDWWIILVFRICLQRACWFITATNDDGSYCSELYVLLVISDAISAKQSSKLLGKGVNIIVQRLVDMAYHNVQVVWA